MKLEFDERRAEMLVNTVVDRYQQGIFPYENKEEFLPQNLVPESIKNDMETHVRFYFFVCIYMRGGIKSSQAFSALIRLHTDYPDFFVPAKVGELEHRDVQEVLKKYIGWDSKNAATYWLENAKRLVRTWGGNVLPLVQEISSYEEAVLLLANRKHRDAERGSNDYHEGFVGFQHKMVSMFVYFMDWIGLLMRPFLYPSPADFHHYRFFIATEALVVEMPKKTPIRYDRRISKVIRAFLVSYLEKGTATPIEVADALWLYSLRMCGNSPATSTYEDIYQHLGLFPDLTHATYGDPARITRLSGYQKTCGICPIRRDCKHSIPARPYYRKGQIVLFPRPGRNDDSVVIRSPERLLKKKKAVSTEHPKLL